MLLELTLDQSALQKCRTIDYTDIMSYKPVPALGKDIFTQLFDFPIKAIGLGTSFKKKVLERGNLATTSVIPTCSIACKKSHS